MSIKIGSQFGSLVVINNCDALILCECQCGNTTLVNPEYLLNGFVQNCDADEKDNYNIFELD